MFQNRYGTLIGQSEREAIMKGQLGTLRRLVGRSLNKFLSECQCGRTQFGSDQCTDLNHYEASSYVSFRGNQVVDLSDDSFPKLSTFFGQYLDDLLAEIDIYFPGEAQKNKAKLKMSAFDPFDHKKWPSSRSGIAEYVPLSIEDASNMFGVNYNNNLQEDFNKLVTNILKNSLEIEPEDMVGNQELGITNQHFWCNHKRDDHLIFWIHVLEKFSLMSEDLQLLIRKILTVPMGSGKSHKWKDVVLCLTLIYNS